MAALTLPTPYSFGAPEPPPYDERPPSRPRTPQRREVLLSKRKQKRRDQDAQLREALRRLQLDGGGDAEPADEAPPRASVVADCIADPASLNLYLSCAAPRRADRRRRRDAPESATTEALRGWFRVERSARSGLRDDQAPAVERRLVDWLSDDRPLSPQRLLAPRGLKLRAPYGGGARGRLVVHAVAKFHGCASRTLPDADDVVLIERPREAAHRLGRGARVAHALDHFRRR